MEVEGFLDPLNEIHLAALHYVYLPVINDELKVWTSAWSCTSQVTHYKIFANSYVGLWAATKSIGY